ncbi:MAG: ArsR family transcriptional regulator [Methanomicrobiales archaeon]|nr:ArsR family transcriptional regulator [Methanomicrobiales archaeon]
MLDQAEVARILDILGNRNRRRIIELLRQKPCFVTEISDRLMLSPKAVIEHLQLMEREEILSFRLDERRRKYYFLANDISVIVNLTRKEETGDGSADRSIRFRQSLATLRRLVDAREEMNESLRTLEKNIDMQIRDIVQYGRVLLDSDDEINLLIALAHCDLTTPELAELTGLPEQVLAEGLKNLTLKQFVKMDGRTFRLRGTNGTE